MLKHHLPAALREAVGVGLRPAGVFGFSGVRNPDWMGSILILKNYKQAINENYFGFCASQQARFSPKTSTLQTLILSSWQRCCGE